MVENVYFVRQSGMTVNALQGVGEKAGGRRTDVAVDVLRRPFDEEANLSPTLVRLTWRGCGHKRDTYGEIHMNG